MIDSTLDLLSAQPEKDALYYLIPVTLKIEDTLFRIPRFILMSNSPIFQDMFAIPQGEGGTTQIEGSRDTNPIILDHVDKMTFDISWMSFCLLIFHRQNLCYRRKHGSQSSDLSTCGKCIGSAFTALTNSRICL
ncbi:hypothetical protein E4T56_gene11540 [Termitomyces sp. T112]|nr:hypothetical protein E4T56_gene11540 [Termitomyces sp. T112]